MSKQTLQVKKFVKFPKPPKYGTNKNRHHDLKTN